MSSKNIYNRYVIIIDVEEAVGLGAKIVESEVAF